MKDSADSPARRHVAPAAMILLAATMAGSSLGIIIANHDALPIPGNGLFGQNIGGSVPALFHAKTEAAESEAPDRVPPAALPESVDFSTGVPSIGTIHCSLKPESALLTFDLENARFIRTARLSAPDRIFIDLQSKYGDRGARSQDAKPNALELNGDLVRRIRVAPRESDAVRVVMDLKRVCDFRFRVSPESPPQLFVELFEK